MTDEELIEAARKACGEESEDPLQEGGMLILSVNELRKFITEVITRNIQ